MTRRGVSANLPASAGVGFGALSGRAVMVRTAAGAELGTAVHQERPGVTTGARVSLHCHLTGPGQGLSGWIDVLPDALPEALARDGLDLAPCREPEPDTGLSRTSSAATT